MRRNVYSVGQVNKYIKDMFSQDFLLNKISVKGEVSNRKYHSSGHIYFSLKDDTGTISAVMFAGQRLSGLKFQLENGDNVIVSGAVRTYEKNGTYQLYAQTIELDGAGALFLRYEALKKELEEMGMFAPEYKQPIPRYIHRLGVVTAPTGAAVWDIRNISRRRNPYVQVILYPVQVQGDGAAQSIVEGIQALDQFGVDTIIVGRGGGSIEDLWAFNEKIVARAIFDCATPIISAVGHETDVTIADFVADLRAPTPSAAAELAVYDYMELRQELQGIKSILDIRMQNRLEKAFQQLEQLKLKLSYVSPRASLETKKQYIAELEDHLTQRMQYRIEEKKHQLQLLCQQLETGSPARKLSQGFSYVTDAQGQPLASVSQVSKEDMLLIRTLDGSICAEVREVEKGYGRADDRE